MVGSVEEVNAASVRLAHEYAIVVDRLATIRAGIVRAREELRGRLGNTQHPDILRAEHLVAVAERQILEAEGALLRSAEAAGELAETLRTGRGTSAAPPNADTDSSPETPAAAGSGGLGAWLRRAAARLPIRAGDRGPTHGVLADDQGHPIEDKRLTRADGLLRSGGIREARTGLRPDWYPTAQVTWEHVEAHAAAALRGPGAPRHGVLVINNVTCRSLGRYVGCDEVLSGMLPAGSTLAVHVTTDGRNARLLRTYRGTGEGIEP